MAKGYSYVVARDYGFAPNPFWGVLTLATCKPKIRKSANVGDYVIGHSAASDGNKLIFIMKVGRVITFDEYWNSDEFEIKKPVMSGSLTRNMVIISIITMMKVNGFKRTLTTVMRMVSLIWITLREILQQQIKY